VFDELLEKIGKALDEHKVPYMIIGGQAILIYGEPRLTRDIDVTLGVGIDRLPEIRSIADALKLKPLTEDIEEFVNRTYVYPTREEGTDLKVDFIFSYSEFERQAIQNARKIKIGDTGVKFAALEDLIIHKVVAGRPRDLEDVRIVLLKNPQADVTYIEKWLDEFDCSLSGNHTRTFREILKQMP
jgi:predicted nucleotidyltransferase